jgi:hypothetical protein
MASLTMMKLDGTTPVLSPHFGEQVTFKVETKAAQVNVVAIAYQDGAVVYAESHYFPPSPFGFTFTLGPTQQWSGGPAELVAKMYDTTKPKASHSLASQTLTVSG